MIHKSRTRIAQHPSRTHGNCRVVLLLGCSMFFFQQACADELEQFRQAWKSASRGEHAAFTLQSQGLENYILYPYLVYEDMRHRRASVPPAVMASFLERHKDWAFSAGLRTSWQKTLGQQGQWKALRDYASDASDTTVRCLYTRSLIEGGFAPEALPVARSLWLAGKSQPDECDPVFSWLVSTNGITEVLAWERVRLAMLAGNSRLALYLARYIPETQRSWLDTWQILHRTHYRNLAQASSWPDEELPRMIAESSLLQLARRDPERAWETYEQLDGHFGWDENTRGGLHREIALQSAVSLSAGAPEILSTLPATHRDEQVLQWWARTALVGKDWATLAAVITQMPPESAADGRWRYWLAVATDYLGDSITATTIREQLASESSYYGFLAADLLNWPYTICPQEPEVRTDEIEQLRALPGVARALELRAAEMENWALAEWSIAMTKLNRQQLRAAAGLAHQEGWHDRAIFALGNSGDQRYYEWRFPLLWTREVGQEASDNKLDPAWVQGVMRSESALAENARSSAGALGLMQITPATAARLARRHGLTYRGSAQLEEAGSNIRFGTRFMRELLDRYNGNPVLVSGAYNAGPQAVDRWLDSRPRGDAASWIESIPYFETRDYIPRVLAFTAIYDWRMNQPVTRVSSRMPDLDSGKMGPPVTTQVVCHVQG